MNDEQRQKIKAMRLQGFGYKRISDAIGLTRDSVRGYCRKNGLDGYGKELAKENKKVIEEEFLFILCCNCGAPLEQNKLGRKRKYCSMECKREWEKGHRKSYIFHCEYCGKEFKSLGTKKRKYCNQECYTKDRFWREEDAKEVAMKILEFKKVNHLPKWLKDLLISNTEV
ncbi:MAG TPA: RNA polymerase subunit sigma-24 [Clostridiales bacterium]|nr:RNA polymerase subunit sigma-24 [Clostridiales bacterium]